MPVMGVKRLNSPQVIESYSLIQSRLKPIYTDYRILLRGEICHKSLSCK